MERDKQQSNMKTLVKLELEYSQDAAETITCIQEFVYRTQSFFYGKSMPTDKKFEFMSKWMSSIFEYKRDARFIFNGEVWQPTDKGSIGNIVKLDVASKLKYNETYHVLIDFREEELGMVRMVTSSGTWRDVNIFDVGYTKERET